MIWGQLVYERMVWEIGSSGNLGWQWLTPNSWDKSEREEKEEQQIVHSWIIISDAIYLHPQHFKFGNLHETLYYINCGK